MTQELKQKLDSIVGKEFFYQEKRIKIERYKEVGGTNVVIFMPHARNFYINELNDFINSLKLAPQKQTPQIKVQNAEVQIIEPIKEYDVIKSTLLSTLEKVKEDKNYIPQAKAVCGVVSEMVNVVKTEIQVLKMIQKNQ